MNYTALAGRDLHPQDIAGVCPAHSHRHRHRGYRQCRRNTPFFHTFQILTILFTLPFALELFFKKL
jgi:hypothetical protein